MRNRQVYIIAEAGVNHNGSLDMAKKLVDAAVEAGADAVKFQSFKADKLVSINAPKANYQQTTTDSTESQLDMLKKLELDESMHQDLAAYCKQQNIQFLSTPFDSDSLHMLVKQFDLPYIKIPSGEITNAPFLIEIAAKGKPVILSTGMSTLSEIEMALWVLAYGYINKETDTPNLSKCRKAYISSEGQQALQEKVTLLHCTTEYPAPFQEVNLNAIKTLHSAFGLSVGYSDHTPGIAVTIAAVACGANVIEKHFTLNKNLPGPDHKASLEPKELQLMVQSIRQVEAAMGNGIKIPSPSELANAEVARKSLVVQRNIVKGEVFDVQNLSVKRPGNGISPMDYWDYLGKSASRNYAKNELIDHE